MCFEWEHENGQSLVMVEVELLKKIARVIIEVNLKILYIIVWSSIGSHSWVQSHSYIANSTRMSLGSLPLSHISTSLVNVTISQ